MHCLVYNWDNGTQVRLFEIQYKINNTFMLKIIQNKRSFFERTCRVCHCDLSGCQSVWQLPTKQPLYSNSKESKILQFLWNWILRFEYLRWCLVGHDFSRMQCWNERTAWFVIEWKLSRSVARWRNHEEQKQFNKVKISMYRWHVSF